MLIRILNTNTNTNTDTRLILILRSILPQNCSPSINTGTTIKTTINSNSGAKVRTKHKIESRPGLRLRLRLGLGASHESVDISKIAKHLESCKHGKQSKNPRILKKSRQILKFPKNLCPVWQSRSVTLGGELKEN